MSLVAYGNSSDDESDDYDSSDEKQQEPKSSTNNSAANNSIVSADAEPAIASTLTLKLPSPKKQPSTSVIEEDDEFLHKKAVPTEPPPPPKPVKRGTVQITIPALQKQDQPKLNKKFIGAQPNKPAGLLNLLPKPTFGSFSKKAPSNATDAHSSTSSTTKSKQSNGFIPHSVAKVAATAKKVVQKPPSNDDGNSGSESSDNEDYFSFHTETKLPEVSQQEINAMVAKKAADMRTATTTYLESMERENVDIEADTVESERSNQSRIDEEALAALCGAKRARRGEGPSVVIELTGDQVLPNRDEWLRNQLQSTTEYQPRGLVDEEPAAGTRKKHQITYLAHQAKANEQELQAMWAANRHTRRQTQNKYGF